MANATKLTRTLLAIVIVLSIATGATTRAGAKAPIVPPVTAHHHWDHHGFVWLPRHPVYESAEIMSIDTAGNPYRAVWVFFTERAGGKRQHHFFPREQERKHAKGRHAPGGA